MFEIEMNDQNTRLAGYSELIKRLNLEVIQNWHISAVSKSGIHRIDRNGLRVYEIYPSRYWPGDELGAQFEFALKYDGINLAILYKLFRAASQEEIIQYIKSTPTGIYTRRLWFLYEFLMGSKLPLEDLKQGNYIDLLSPDDYYTIDPPRTTRRQRINDNLIGDYRFCPTIRRTKALTKYESADLANQCQDITSAYPEHQLQRALNYLYTKETKSSYKIENEKPSSSRIERFIQLLQIAEAQDFCDKPNLLELQNRIVDPRFQAHDYRDHQNYIGETVTFENERIHYVCPKPEDIVELMNGLLYCHGQMEAGGVHEVIHAGAIAYGFVYLHPFEDGNGRIHRFLIHNILARRGFTPKGLMFPVSASMLKNQSDYDTSLETFSNHLKPLVEYSLDAEGQMTVQNDTSGWYKYIDLTSQVEALFGFIQDTINVELKEELEFLQNYDEAKKAIQEVVDMPDRAIDNFIRFCLQNHGVLSITKREKFFDFLSNDEIAYMEKSIRDIYKTAESIS